MSGSLPPFKLQFTDGLGNTVDFLSGNLNLTNHTGFEGSMATHREIEQPFRDSRRYFRSDRRDLFPTVTFELEGANYANLMAHRRLIIPVLSPMRGLGVLAYQAASGGPEYRIDALVERKAHVGNPQLRVMYENWSVQWRCPNPYWRTPTATETNVSTTANVTNGGDVASYPVWTVTPGSTITSPTLTNQETGKFVTFSGLSVASGETLVVDMLNQTAELDGVSVMSDLTTDSEFWALVLGSQTVEVSHVSGSATWTMAHFDWFEGV